MKLEKVITAQLNKVTLIIVRCLYFILIEIRPNITAHAYSGCPLFGYPLCGERLFLSCEPWQKDKLALSILETETILASVEAMKESQEI